MGNPLRSGGLIGEADGAIGDGAPALLCRSWAAPQPRAARRCPPAAGPPGAGGAPHGQAGIRQCGAQRVRKSHVKGRMASLEPEANPAGLAASSSVISPACYFVGRAALRHPELRLGAEAAARQRQKPRPRVLGLSLGGCSRPAPACGSSLTVTCQIHLRDIHWAAGKCN